MELREYYNYLIDRNIVSGGALQLIIEINGYNEQTLDDVLHSQTGYRDIKSYLYYEDKETFKEYYSPDNIKEII